MTTEMRSLNNYSDMENISLELGYRAYHALCAESDGIIEGISTLKWAELLQDEYDAGDPMGRDNALASIPGIGLFSGNDLPDFTLLTGLRIMYHDFMEGDLDPWVLANWFPEYERELVAQDEARAADEWEEWVATGGMDE